MKKIRYAVLGAGWISQEAFLPAVSQTENSVVTAIISGSPQRARELADFHGVEHIFDYAQYGEMLAADIVDAVYVALPNSMHADYTIQAAKTGKHILVEKPLATTEADCLAMIVAADSAKVFLMTAYRLHSEPGTLDILDQIYSGQIGDPRTLSANFSFMPVSDNHRLASAYWGGPLQDIGVYCLNLARHVFRAEPTEAIAVKTDGNGDPRFAEVAESFAVTLRFPGDRVAQFIASFGTATCDFYHVAGTKGSILVNPGFRFETAMRMERRVGDDFTETRLLRADHFAGMIAYFSDCILQGNPPEADGHEGLADVRALLAIERAAASGFAQPIQTAARPVHPSRDMARTLPVTDRRLVF